VRDYVKEKIGEEYLKPVLQIIGENPLSRESGELANQSANIPSPGRGLGRGFNNDISTCIDQIKNTNTPPYPAKAVLSPQGGTDVRRFFDRCINLF